MPFSFEKFTETDASYAARVAVRQNGQIGFNSGTINKFRVSEYAFCVLYYDRSAKAVGIWLTNDQSEEGAIPIRSTPANTYVRAKNFLDKYEVDYASSSRHVLKREESSGMLYFLLGESIGSEDENPEDPSLIAEPEEPTDYHPTSI